MSLEVMGVRREDCDSTRRWLTTLREEHAELKRQAESKVSKMETLASNGAGNSRNGKEMFARLERETEALDSRMREIEAEVRRVQSEGGDEPRDARIAPQDAGVLYRADGTRSSGGVPGGRTPLLGREARMADWAAKQPNRSGFTVADGDEFSLGNIMRAMVEPRFRAELTDVERRVLAEGVDATGGFLTPEPLSANLIDKVRNQARVFEAGAVTVPLDSDKQSIPRVSGDPTGGWRAENAAFSESNLAFDRVTFTPQSFGFIVRTSEELYQDMVPGSAAIIENAIVQTAALELDRVALRGSGTAPEPRGVRNQAGVTIQSLGANGATPTDYSPLVNAISTLQQANRNPTAIIQNPRTEKTWASLKDTTNQPLRAPAMVEAVPRLQSAQIPVNLTQGTAVTASEVYVGEWADLLIGIRLGIQLRLLQERYADSGQYAWRVFLRADVQLAHPESFVVTTGVLP